MSKFTVTLEGEALESHTLAFDHYTALLQALQDLYREISVADRVDLMIKGSPREGSLEFEFLANYDHSAVHQAAMMMTDTNTFITLLHNVAAVAILVGIDRNKVQRVKDKVCKVFLSFEFPGFGKIKFKYKSKESVTELVIPKETYERWKALNFNDNSE